MIRDQRSQGRHTILDIIRRVGPIARVDLATRTGVSQATVTAITAELLATGLIEEDRSPAQSLDAKRGRPRVGLVARGPAHRVAGVKVTDRAISAAILDFAGAPLGEATLPLTARALPGPALAQAIADVAAAAARSAGLTPEDISALGVGLMGLVDAEAGLVRWSPALDTRDVPLRDLVRTLTDRPVFIDNDANLVAMAEVYFGEGRALDDFLVVTVESGLGLGIVLGGQVYRGVHGCGAEFGHTKVALDGALCRCGQRGCLEAYIADYALLAALEIPEDDPIRDFAWLLREAQAGAEAPRQVLTQAQRYFALGLANLVNIFDPEVIILAGETCPFEYLLSDDLPQIMAQHMVPSGPPPEVRVHRWTDLMWARGAAAYAIEGLSNITLDHIGTDG